MGLLENWSEWDDIIALANHQTVRCATHLLSSPFANTGEYRGCPINSLRYDG
jgi:hypothetical protein